MVDRTGLHVAPVPGANPIGTAPVDGRLVQAALFGSTGQCLNGGGLTPSSSTMAFTVAAGVYQIPDTANGGAVYHSPIDSAVLTPAAGQSGGRVDSIYVLQQDYEKNGSTSRVVYGIAAGIPGSGVAPSLSGIAGGPMRLANISVPASATKATDCTVTWVVPPATLALDGAIAANKALLDLLPGTYIGQRSYAGGVDYRWNGTAWKPWDSDWITNFTPSVAGLSGSYVASARWRYTAGQVLYEWAFALGSGVTSSSQIWVYLPVDADLSPNYFGTGYGTPAGNAWALDAQDGNRRYQLGWQLANNRNIALENIVAGGTGRLTGSGNAQPFSWAQQSGAFGRVLYDPA